MRAVRREVLDVVGAECEAGAFSIAFEVRRGGKGGGLRFGDLDGGEG